MCSRVCVCPCVCRGLWKALCLGSQWGSSVSMLCWPLLPEPGNKSSQTPGGGAWERSSVCTQGVVSWGVLGTACAWAGGCGWEEGGGLKQCGGLCDLECVYICGHKGVWSPTSHCLEEATEAPVSGRLAAGPELTESQTQRRLGLPACLSSHVCGGVILKRIFRDFSGGPVVKTPHFQCRVEVQSLVRELRSYMLHAAKRKFLKQGI